jgi:4'-phosphopantetheinyl transferase EntD
LGRIAAKKAISEIAEGQNIQSIFIDFGIFQFPVVKYCTGQNIQVSISHCDDIGIALAFPEEHPLGTDIERIDTDKIEAIQSQVTAKEVKLIEELNLPFDAGCTIIWTIKEALSKIFRTGMMMDFTLLEISSLEKAGLTYMGTFCYTAQYKAISFHSGNYVCSVVVPKNTTPVLEEFWQAFVNTTSS